MISCLALSAPDFCALLAPFMASLLALDSSSALGSDFGGVNGVLSGGSEEKAGVALKSHCEAERRRRERINAHLTTLRALIPSTHKMDKSTLLGAVIDQVKELKKTATEGSKGFLVPTDADEVRIEPLDSEAGDGTLYFSASLCCEYRTRLLTDIKQAFDALELKLDKAEVSTLGRRVKIGFALSRYRERLTDDDDVSDARQLLAASIHRSLTCVIDMSATLDYSLKTAFPNKKSRISFDSLSSSSREL